MTPSELAAELRKIAEKMTPGEWKLWGMDVTTQELHDNGPRPIASTYQLDENGRPRTWDANLICLLRNNLPTILQALDRTAGPVEWTEADERELQRIDAADAAYISGSPTTRWLSSKLRAFVAAQKGARP